MLSIYQPPPLLNQQATLVLEKNYPDFSHITQGQEAQLRTLGLVWRFFVSADSVSDLASDFKEAQASRQFSRLYVCWGQSEENLIGLFGIPRSNKNRRVLIGEYTRNAEIPIPSYQARLKKLRAVHEEQFAKWISVWTALILLGLAMLIILVKIGVLFAMNGKGVLNVVCLLMAGSSVAMLIIGIRGVGSQLRWRYLLRQPPPTDLLLTSFRETDTNGGGSLWK